MMEEPKSGEEAMAVILEAIDAAAKKHGRELDPTCLSTFEGNNIERFKEVFTDTFWSKSKSNLHKVTELHGMISAKLSMLLEPSAPTVSFAIFREAGVFVRSHCPVVRPEASPQPGIRKKGDWCTWP